MKVWYCFNCGYEVTAKGRCHQCKERLLASPLPSLEEAENDDDEVGYRVKEWSDPARGRLIHSLVRNGVHHRFEADELVVGSVDEETVDELIAQAADVDGHDPVGVSDGSRSTGSDSSGDDAAEFDDGAGFSNDELDVLIAQVRRLHDAAGRLRSDPTDMEADGDVAEASTAVFVTDHLATIDSDVWSAVGRTTRRLLGALGSEEAEDDEIRRQAGILSVLIAPIADNAETVAAVLDREGLNAESSETVYELPEWLPEQRAELSVLLDEAGVISAWDGADLVVPVESESAVEALFDKIHGIESDDVEDEAQYQQIEELFAATSRLAGDPSDPTRAAEYLRTVPAVEGSAPLGFDGISWSAIRKRARVLADSIAHKANPDVVAAEATTLRDLLRALV